jgi:Spy/CpxP family protein refolding chaperone
MKRMNTTTMKFLATSALYFSLATLGHAEQFPRPLDGNFDKNVEASRPIHSLPKHGPDFPRAEFGLMPPPFLRDIELSEQQQDGIFNILHKYATANRESEKVLHKSSTALHALGNTNKYDEATAKTLAQSIGKASADLALIHVQVDHQIYDLLTPEQRARIEQGGNRFDRWPHDRPPMPR